MNYFIFNIQPTVSSFIYNTIFTVQNIHRYYLEVFNINELILECSRILSW